MSDLEQLPFEISVEEVRQLLDVGADMLLIDCRRPEEHDIASIPTATLLPMHEITQRLVEIDSYRQRRIVVHCHHGGRSERVASWLREQGFQGAQNMVGGIDAWSARIAPDVPRY
ncbi:MAG: rhodanese-like domain-containing protein [Planctomycetota bacterium]|nr:rhodanese-like domain-containing protein [Planctomycetota bacterium]MDA1179501.1 rhodanese-like domain-containing protein [Planctomycetota bacterium]